MGRETTDLRVPSRNERTQTPEAPRLSTETGFEIISEHQTTRQVYKRLYRVKPALQ